ncbi:MAG TPA: MFS transporter [Caulobacteraceae bacterium]|jgi:DHA2 family multidrug resistance protein-like MFS transporter|nr:MFS transporter [Caulobacteraceae bacterium]
MTAIALVMTLAILDGVIANVALPTIARDLHTDPAASIWVVNAYQAAILAALLPLASLGEIVGYRRVYQAGVALFTLASLGCALARDMPTLILVRVIQGLGAAAIMSMNSTIIRFTYPSRLLGSGLGLNAMVVALASVAGPSIASAILAVAPWPWLFAINVPLGVVSFLVGMVSLPNPPGSSRRFDLVSAALNVLAFTPMILGLEGLIEGGHWLLTTVELGVGLFSGTALIVRSLTRSNPLVPIDLMRIPVFAMSIATSTAAFTAQNFAFVALPFLLEYAFGRSAVETGLLMTPWSILFGLVSPIAGRLTDRYPGAVLGSAGLGVMGLGLALLAVLPSHPSAFDICWRMALGGVGFALFQQPNNRALMTSGPRERAGGAGGMLATARLTGQTAGATLVALLFHASGNSPNPKILWVAAGGALVAAAVSWMKPHEAGRPTG